jgi:hypothetical protein
MANAPSCTVKEDRWLQGRSQLPSLEKDKPQSVIEKHKWGVWWYVWDRLANISAGRSAPCRLDRHNIYRLEPQVQQGARLEGYRAPVHG